MIDDYLITILLIYGYIIIQESLYAQVLRGTDDDGKTLSVKVK